jgi:hypothetical protein
MIRGIDSQIMINKSVDYAKQLTDQMNNVQQGKDFLAELEKARMERSDVTVEQAEEAEGGRIRREDERQSQNANQEDKKKKKELEELLEEETAEVRQEGLGASIDINI